MQTAFTSIFLLAAGFVLLIKGADFFVDGSSSVARRLHVPSLIIGMTIVAMGTSLPELAVSVTASISGSNSLAVSNVVGSNLFNLMVVLGSSALFTEMTVSMDVLKRDYPFSLGCTILMLALGAFGMGVGRVDGIILLLVFAAFLLLMIRAAKSGGNESAVNEEENGESETASSWGRALLYVVGGAAAIRFGGTFAVNGAVSIARSLGVTQTLIGLTIVACGTSLPELVTSIVAAKKNELDIAVGNVVGSNIFNILLILGVASAISPITILRENVIDIVIMLAFSLVTWVFCVTNQKLSKKEGVVMLLLYAVYLSYICVR